MRSSYTGAPKWVRSQVHDLVRARNCASKCFARFVVATASCAMFSIPVFSQDTGSAEREWFGNGAEIAVTVHDGSGEPVSTAAMVKLYRDGTIPSGQGATSRGRITFVVTSLGEFTVIVEAAGYENAQKDVSVRVAGREQVDVYLRRALGAESVVGVPGKPILAPKAKEALEKGLRALSAEKLPDAEKHVGEAIRLAPGNPDVLYVEGVLRLKQRKWVEAQSALEKATQIDPGYARAYAALGMALCDQAKYAVAIVPLEKSLQLDPDSTWETRWTLAKAYYQHAQYDEALKMSQAALAQSNGKAPEIALLVAQSLTAAGRYEDAANVLREFVKEHADRREAATARKWLERLSASGRIRAN
ncbi:MAG TPA: tetratricopeptide repeat protein [Candidatus Solibacter sp.]|nr:tetratricopeptide repeat protein [Candidatus Solibacter sp.]